MSVSAARALGMMIRCRSRLGRLIILPKAPYLAGEIDNLLRADVGYCDSMFIAGRLGTVIWRR